MRDVEGDEVNVYNDAGSDDDDYDGNAESCPDEVREDAEAK